MDTSIYNILNLRPKRHGDWSQPVKCPFHADKNPSFGVNMKTWRWHCHAGCGSGSIYDYYMRQTGSTYSEAKRIIDEEEGAWKPAPVNPLQREKDLRAEKAEEKYQQWIRNYADILKTCIRLAEWACSKNIMCYHIFAHDVPVWEYHFDIICNGRGSERRALYADVASYSDPFFQNVWEYIQLKKRLEKSDKYMSDYRKIMNNPRLLAFCRGVKNYEAFEKAVNSILKGE